MTCLCTESLTLAKADSGSGVEAFRWTAREQMMIGLDDLPGGVFESHALAVSADGSTILGWGKSENGQEAFVWTKTVGMQRLQSWLRAHGVEVPDGWVLTSAAGISDDRTAIGGFGFNPEGDKEAWLARLPAKIALAFPCGPSVSRIGT